MNTNNIKNIKTEANYRKWMIEAATNKCLENLTRRLMENNSWKSQLPTR